MCRAPLQDTRQLLVGTHNHVIATSRVWRLHGCRVDDDSAPGVTPIGGDDRLDAS
jgi:hypothetical protein